MSERAKVIQLGVSQGLTNLNDIKKGYNNFARGGYTKWKERIKEHKNIDIDNDPTYDYEGFYNSDPDRAWDMMNKNSDAHFVDEYKTARHPSFSNQSIYSGYKNKFNPEGIEGGTWIDDYNYKLSKSQFDNDWDTDATLDYFNWAESSPVHLYAPDGSTVLKGITVTPKSNRKIHKYDGESESTQKMSRYGISNRSGTNTMYFDTKEERDKYAQDRDFTWYQGELPELTVTTKRPRSLLEQGAANFEETFGITPRDAAGFIPYVGDALDVKDIGDNLDKGNYTEAGLGAAMLLLPNVIEKPLKMAKKGIYELLNYGNDWLINPRQTIKSIKEHRYTPLMTKAEKKEYLDNIRYRMQTEVRPFTKEVATNNVRVRNSNKNTGFLEFEPEALEFFGLKYPDLKLKSYIGKSLGKYHPSSNEIHLKTRESLFGQHRFINTEDILGTGAHEYGHFWSYTYPNSVGRLTVPTQNKLTKKNYYGPNKNHQDIAIFEPIFKYEPGSWESSPDEVIAEIFKHKWATKNPSVVNDYSPHLFDIVDPIARRLDIDEHDAAKMIVEMGEKGYSYGGYIK